MSAVFHSLNFAGQDASQLRAGCRAPRLNHVSILSRESLVVDYAGSFDGVDYSRPDQFNCHRYVELRPISDRWEPEAMAVNGLDRTRLIREGAEPTVAMTETAAWVREVAAGRRPILVAYPLSFDWTFLYWYFVSFSGSGSPFNHSGCFDLKTAFAVKADVPSR